MTLVLCLPDGTLLGALPPFRVPSPFWRDMADVVDGARSTYHVEVTVLRLLSAEREQAWQGGPVSYLAQVGAVPRRPLRRWPGDPVADAPRRLPYARPGGPSADLAWADAVLVDRGTPRTAPAAQVRTWNLSSIWRLPTGEGPAWLKVVPPFFAHEGAVLARLPPGLGPPLLAADGGRLLMAEVAGEDQYEAPLPELLRMVDLLVGLQAGWVGRVEELLALGLPDWRHAALSELAAETVRRTADQLDGAARSRLDVLVDCLPERFAAIAACGIPDTLVHGDFHPGNVHGTGSALVLLDWGDCGVGHPLLDQAAFLDRRTEMDRRKIRAEWTRLWRAAAPGSDPDRAATLIEPVAALRQAVVYRSFLDNIEDDEQVYHAADPADWLYRAAALAG